MSGIEAKMLDRRRLVTGAVWAVGIALQLAAPLLRDRVPHLWRVYFNDPQSTVGS